MLNVNVAERMLKESVSISEHSVTLAKGYIIKNAKTVIGPFNMALEYARSLGYSKPDQIFVADETSFQPHIHTFQGFYTAYLSFCEAVFQLIGSGEFFPHGEFITNQTLAQVRWDTGNMSSSWMFGEYNVMMPRWIKRAFSKVHNTTGLFPDENVYVLEMGVENADSEVIDALKDSISCFRNNLFRPSLAMLGKATEGAWIECGIALSKFMDDQDDRDQLVEKLKGQDSFVWKVSKIVKMYEDKGVYKDLQKESNISLNQLREAATWTDIVRNSRNAIHFGVKPTTEITYESASIILIAARTHLGNLYEIKRNADRMKG